VDGLPVDEIAYGHGSANAKGLVDDAGDIPPGDVLQDLVHLVEDVLLTGRGTDRWEGLLWGCRPCWGCRRGSSLILGWNENGS
jgi:hypothetical protein